MFPILIKVRMREREKVTAFTGAERKVIHRLEAV
jgi:hypothetical protein